MSTPPAGLSARPSGRPDIALHQRSADARSVSVIVVVKDGARFIGQALASIGLSRVEPLEILVIDGGSTDDTVAIAASTPGVTVIPQASRGISGAYNEGVERSAGRVLAFLSADDLWRPGKLERHLEALDADPGLLISVSLVEHFLEPGSCRPKGFRRELLDEARPGLLMEALVVRRQAFDIVGPFDGRYSTAEDTDWFARAKDAGLKIGLIPEVLVRKRVHGANASLVDPRGHQNRLRLLRASIARKRAAAVASG